MQNRYVDLNMPEYEKLVTCPLNKAHQVVKHRMANHLIKCRRSHSTKGLKECRFNSTHLVPEADFARHEASCEDRLIVTRFMSSIANKKKPADSGFSSRAESLMSIASTSSASADPTDWDTSVDHPAYDPKLKCKESNVVVHIQHATPSQRQEMREEEHERLQLIRLAKEAEEAV